MKLFLFQRAALVAASLVAASSASAQVFSNAASITIPDSGTGTPYPSTITVAGGPVSIPGIRVTLTGLSHTFTGDVAILVVAPTGQKVMLFGNPCSGTTISGVNLTFGNIPGATSLPCPPVSGLYLPTGGGATLSAPAPAGPYSNNLNSVVGSDANGVWSLYVQDFVGGDSGAISGGWRIEFAAEFPQATNASVFTYQGRLTGGAVSGLIDARFTLWDVPTDTNVANRVAGPTTNSGITLANGLFTTAINFGAPIPGDRQTYLEIEVANPAGSAFVPLTPRQPISMAPLTGNLASSTQTPDVARIGGRQGHQVTGSLTIQAPGTIATNGAGSRGGTLRLAAGNCNSSAGGAPPVGTSLDNNVHIIAGDNTFAGAFGSNFNGNIQFFGGNGLPERVRIVGDNGNVGIGTDNPGEKLHVIGNILATGSITPSCAALKENVVPMADALDRLASLEAVRFDWKADEAAIRGFTHDLGFIADDVARVFPEVVFRNDKGEIIGLDYSRMSAVAVGAIKQLKCENDDLKARLERLEALMAAQSKAQAK